MHAKQLAGRFRVDGPLTSCHVPLSRGFLADFVNITVLKSTLKQGSSAESLNYAVRPTFGHW